MFETDERGRIYYVASHIGDLAEMLGCRVVAIHKDGALGEREGIITSVKCHHSARLWEVTFKGDTPTLNLVGDEWKNYEWRVFDDRVTCKNCDTEGAHTHFIRPIGERLRRFSVCQTCDYWFNMIGETWADDQWEGQQVLRVDGRHYTVGSVEKGRGHGGRTFEYVLLNDETETVHVSRNLWSQSEIPERFRYWLPDNARFIPEDPTPTYAKLGLTSKANNA